MSDWQKTSLGDIAETFLSGGTPSTKRPEFWQGDIPWITSKWLGKKLELNDGEKLISKEATKITSTRIVPRDNIIFATRVGVGKIGVNRIDLAINQDLAGVLVDKDKFDIQFIAFQLGTDSIQQFVAMNKRGATIKGITRDCLKSIRLNLPALSEQKKIAHVLSTVQRAIEQQERIIQSTTELKKSLMQKLFTEGLRGESQKQTEIGPIPESWEVVEVGDIVTIKGGKRLPKGEKLVTNDTGYAYIRVTDFSEFTVDISEVRFLTSAIQKQICRYIINMADIYISIAGSIGISGMIPSCLDGANLTENAARLINKDNTILYPRYLMYWLASEYCQNEIKSQTVKNAQPKLALNRIQSLKVALPSFKDQKDIVSSIDLVEIKISNTAMKKKSLQSLLRTLLHELMTAKIRVDGVEFGMENMRNP